MAAAWQAVERRLSDIVSDFRVVTIHLAPGGEMHLCLRVDPQKVAPAEEVARRREQLAQRRPQQQQWAGMAHAELAEVCYHSGLWKEAEDLWRQALRIDPRAYPAAVGLGKMLREQRREQEAAQVWQEALRVHPPLPPALAARLRGSLLLAEGDPAGAVEAFREALSLDPKEAANYRGLHTALGAMSRYEEQLENLAALRQVEPNDLFGYLGVYHPCARLHRFDLALPLMEKAVALDPNYPVAVNHLFQARMNLGLLDAETLALAERLVRLAPELVDSWNELSWIYAEMGRQEESLAVLQAFLEEHPQNAEAHAALAWRHHYLWHREEAADCAVRAYRLAPQDAHICWTLLVMVQHSQRLSDADAFGYAEEVASRFPHDAFLLGQVALVFCEHREGRRALEYARRAVALDPVSRNARGILADACWAAGRWEEAASIYEGLIAEFGEATGLLAWLGEAQARLGDARAEATLARVRALAKTPQDWKDLGRVLERCGRVAEALEAYRRCAEDKRATPLLRLYAKEAIRRLQRLQSAPSDAT